MNEKVPRIPDHLLAQLGNTINVVRQKAVTEVLTFVEANAEQRSLFEDICLKFIASGNWRERESGFNIAAGLSKRFRHNNLTDSKFGVTAMEKAREGLTDPESRVRLAVGKFFHVLCTLYGVKVYLEIKGQLINLVEENFARPDRKVEVVEEHSNDIGKSNEVDSEEKPAGSKREQAKRYLEEQRRKLFKAKTGQHDTEGWKCLYSAFKTVEQCVRGSGSEFALEPNDKLFELMVRSTKHINRFVRECAFELVDAICISCEAEQMSIMESDLATLIAFGLTDNWSQVRYASSVAVRSFLGTIGCKRREKYFPALLPPMCLNRYYVAAGVRTYSQETWRDVFAEGGANCVAEHIDSVVFYYVLQAQADNHAVREAACHCISELARKVNRKAVESHVRKLLDALIACFKDESWPVRDAACIALGGFVQEFPVASKDDHDELFQLWFAHLGDNIPSVRENTAHALGSVAKVLGPPAINRIIEKLKELLPLVKSQAKESVAFGGLEKTSHFGVAKPVQDPMAARFVNQALFSCGSLAPKMKRATRCGCMDHGFSRPQEPWEKTDGAVHLLGQLAGISPQKAFKLVPLLMEAIRIRHFRHFHLYAITVWSNMAILCEKLKLNMEFYLGDILEELADTLGTNNRLAEDAAEKCLRRLSTLYGTNRLMSKCPTSRIRRSVEEALSKK